MDVHESPSRRRALAIGLASVGAFSASLTKTSSSRAADLTPIHIATNVSESAANAYFADDQGFFKQQGLDAKIDSFASSGQYVNGIISGSFDVGAVACGSLVSGHAKGIPFVFLANGGIYNFETPQTMLVVPKESALKNAVDFRGKTIAVSTLGDIVQVAVMAWLDKNGQDPKGVNFVEIPPSVTAAAITSGRIDAAFLGEPYLTESLDVLKTIAAPSTAVANHFLVTGWTASRSWVAANQPTVRKFQAAMTQASNWASKNRTAAMDVVVSRAKIPPDIAPRLHHVSWDPSNTVAYVQPVIDAMLKYGILAKGFPASQLFN
jgi:NitT/TauT family transport system substrate-binding protein